MLQSSVIVRLPTSRSDSSSLGLRRRSARPPGPPAPGHRQAGARAKRPVPALMLSYGLGACGAPASQPQCRACDVEVLTRRAPFLVVQGGRLQLVSSAQPPPARRGCIGGGRRPRHSPRGARSPCGAPRRRQARPLVPRGTLGGRPARRRVVEGARYGGPDPEGLQPATPCRRRPQGRDVCPHIVGARGARLCDKHDRTPKRPTLLLP